MLGHDRSSVTICHLGLYSQHRPQWYAFTVRIAVLPITWTIIHHYLNQPSVSTQIVHYIMTKHCQPFIIIITKQEQILHYII